MAITDPANGPSVAVQLLPTDQPPTLTDYPRDGDYRCGVWRWRPRCLQKTANICAFLVAACFISFLQAAFSGYSASQVTTLEKRFAVGSSVIGFINAFFEVGYIISVIFVSYAGGRSHVPAVISVGLFIMAAGAFLWTVPHFVFPYKPMSNTATTPLSPLCLRTSNGTSPNLSSNCVRTGSSGYGFLPILFLAQLLIGSGSSPILTLIPPFIDDHVEASKAPRMIASQYAAAALGPVFGFALGACVLQYPAELFTSSTLSPDDPNWIGAWWVGFILFGVLVFFGGFVLLSFPRRLNEQPRGSRHRPSTLSTAPQTAQENGVIPVTACNNEASDANQSNAIVDADPRCPWFRSCSRPCSRSGRTPYTCAPQLRCAIIDSPSKASSKFASSVRSLIRNHVYLVICLGICSEMFMIIGFASFLPKYIELEYQTSKWLASVIAGGLIVPAGALGILVGGLILQRFCFHRRDAIRFVLAINAVITSCIVAFFFLGCDNPPIAGLTAEYPKDSSIPASIPSTGWFEKLNRNRNLKAPCNSDCRCDPGFWSPVCHSHSGMSFSSPCFAGCTNGSAESTLYDTCSCVPLPVVQSMSKQEATVRSGLCPIRCDRLGYFVPVLTLCLFLTGVIQNPLIMVTMRSVGHQERSFALGLQFVIIRLLANLPSPMVFGRVIDEACLLWRFDCGRQGDCAYVDVRNLNAYVTCLGLAIKGSGFFFYIALLYLLRSAPLGRTSAAPNFVRKPSAPLSGPSAARRTVG